MTILWQYLLHPVHKLGEGAQRIRNWLKWREKKAKYSITINANRTRTSWWECISTTWREGTGTAAAARGICTPWGKDCNGWLKNVCPDCAWFPDWVWPPIFPRIPSVSFPREARPGAFGWPKKAYEDSLYQYKITFFPKSNSLYQLKNP